MAKDTNYDDHYAVFPSPLFPPT